MSAKRLGVVLACFKGANTAARTRRRIVGDLKSNGDVVCDSVVVRVDTRHHLTVYDPHRLRAGAFTAALTWGVFGALTGGGATGFIVWGIIGALCGAAFAYVHEHLLTKAQLTRIGTTLPAGTSALLTFIESKDVPHALEMTARRGTSVTSAAEIDQELCAQAHSVGLVTASEPGHDAAAVSMLVFRYGDQSEARRIASRINAAGEHTVANIELVIERDTRGRLHVVDPTHGV